MKLKTSVLNNISKKFVFHFLISLILLGNYSGNSDTLKRENNDVSEGYRWVFWSYEANGERRCANLCIITGLILVILVSSLIICCSWCIWHYINKTKSSNGSENRRKSTHVSILTDEQYEKAKDFTRDNPPQEELPPPEIIAEIQSFGGARAWKWVSKELGQKVSIGNEGDIIEFFNHTDTSIQTNYPCFVPVNESSESVVVKGGQIKYSEAMFEQPQSLPHRKLHYYEMTIMKNMDFDNTNIVIGLATKPYPNFRLPGLNLYSVGYHSINGKKYNNDNFGIEYGPEWIEAEYTVGCGYDSDSGDVFFTLNGKFLGIAFTNIKHIWFPTIGANGPCTVEINFGDNPDNKFKYKEAIGYGPGGPILLSKRRRRDSHKSSSSEIKT
ncbi:concanavalin A-like lectin/glucanase domain-containing protein [Glomus cerebriforme]|uniref:Concanavalin A-like lectin/glucanase domain-containing protein n=1 Tax=Glomus cerebriforme TaxID=658196 RepID=A0A397S0X3_9GLOM|nr:concanavalin A-like lectin/glucanase domain-containing protein [Glomus cerebriforme]